ncbi:GNAT family N-acetyltransferase [Undibacterium umbellatum]|uniref:GNAT family N-acetyltransferase n=1 Tax=Undibacterium umbellatum TaxID=2762300 RepID=A0ABR6ZCY6_9BURK|nr:GNAT family N-acetyltransferase [Undibacterium umbellatum]MBC3909489.1 GNAT family N-acetyltransferase [Undibacterium umbellatum]
MSPSLRPVLMDDYAVIARWITSAQACSRWAGPTVTYPFKQNDLPALLAKPQAQSIVLVDANLKIVGYAQFWPRDEQRVHLGRIIVSPAARGKGYGRLLCEQLMQLAITETGLPVLSLRVYRDNPGALHLYQQLGFAEIEADSNDEVLAMEYKVK